MPYRANFLPCLRSRPSGHPQLGSLFSGRLYYTRTTALNPAMHVRSCFTGGALCLLPLQSQLVQVPAACLSA
jgi:hypothetical protein